MRILHPTAWPHPVEPGVVLKLNGIDRAPIFREYR
jgi:hypothetical protein